eukprot:10511-Heterococcus_DN1.PRE.5
MLTPEDMHLKVLFEDEHLIAVLKPAGVIVQPMASAPKGTLLHGIRAHMPAAVTTAEQLCIFYCTHHMVATGQATAGDSVAAQSLLQGIVHRLDKDTSGVVVVAKHLEASSSLSHLFKTRKVQKRYLAVCIGTPTVPQTVGEFTVDAPIYKRSSGKMAAVRAGPDAEKLGAKAAVTRAKALATAKGLTLCELEITTGRQHQIRAHLSYVGCPVAGDAVYSDITDRGRAEGSCFHYNISSIMQHSDLMFIYTQWYQPVLASVCAFAQCVSPSALHKYELHLVVPIGSLAYRNSCIRAGIKRPLLHASTLELTHPVTRERLVFVAPMPADMWQIARSVLKNDRSQPAQRALRRMTQLQSGDASGATADEGAVLELPDVSKDITAVAQLVMQGKALGDGDLML